MYSNRANLIIGFHGCDESIRDAVINGDKLVKSENKYDWLGHGIYFWEYNYDRALEFAQQKKGWGKLEKPSVLGAVISLHNCYDLFDTNAIKELSQSYNFINQIFEKQGKKLPTNLPSNQKFNQSKDLLFRDLDCLVIETLHKNRKDRNMSKYDSVRGGFFEGNEIYPGAGINEKNHIQLCIRDEKCILGYFKPII